ncbi:MAG: hypothetical protein M5U05_19310 [Anaerolineales bacterium]|nr:hypothetical protein [Anaerolineales bacterium]
MIDFVYRPEIAAQIEAWVNYICPVKGAQEELAKIDEEPAASELIFPQRRDPRQGGALPDPYRGGRSPT